MSNFNSLKAGVPATPAASSQRGVYSGHVPRPFTSREEMQMHTTDPRYNGRYDQQEPQFQAFVEECLGQTDNALLGVGSGLEAAMAEPQRREYQDPQNTLGSMTDVYRDMSEAQRDQSSQLYKTSAFERQRVAEKINRSVPDEAVMSGRERYNGSVKVGFIDPSAGEGGEIGYVSGNGETWKE